MTDYDTIIDRVMWIVYLDTFLVPFIVGFCTNDWTLAKLMLCVCVAINFLVLKILTLDGMEEKYRQFQRKRHLQKWEYNFIKNEDGTVFAYSRRRR